MKYEFLNILIPVATFILGCIFTLLLKRYYDRKLLLQSSIREIARLTTEWYNQIHKEPLSTCYGRPLERKVDSSMYEYVHNRLILPDLLIHLTLLRRFKKCADLVEKVQCFLRKVTHEHPLDFDAEDFHAQQARIRSFIQRQIDLKVLSCNALPSIESDRVHLLHTLDVIIQGISGDVATLLT